VGQGPSQTFAREGMLDADVINGVYELHVVVTQDEQEREIDCH
jgi:negative regulator of genetic competence, sporulation and motility